MPKESNKNPYNGLSRETEIEYNRWGILCEEARAVAIDPDDPEFNLVFRAIAMWGESLVALRVTQTPEQREKAANMANDRYNHLKSKKQ